jgi:hypothetical protein
MLPSDSTSRAGVDAPAVHYVTGAGIVIVLSEGEVQRMEVEGPTRGWHLEPKREPVRDTVPVPDTAAAVAVPGVGGARDEGRSPEDGGAGKITGLPGAVPGQRRRGRGSRR